MTLKFYLGIFTFCLSLLSIILNLMIMPPVFYLAFISKKCPFYLIAFFNIISDMVQLSTTCFYLSSSIMANRYLISSERLSRTSLFFGWLFMNAWFLESIVQATMAVNRLVVISLKKNNIFTFYKTLLFFIGVIVFTSSTAYCSQFMLPCCITILDQAVLSITFVKVEGVYTYSNLLDLSYDIFCTAILMVCYITVFRSIRKTHLNVASNVQRNRNNQDIRYLFQFVFVSIFYIFTWVFFEILTLITIDVCVEFWIIVPICVICNCSSNAVIFLSINREVRKLIKIPCGRKQVYNSNQVVPATNTDNSRV